MTITNQTAQAARLFSAFFWLLLYGALSTAPAQSQTAAGEGWGNYGGDSGGMRYSGASQITGKNVTQLQPAWTFHTGALQQETKLIRKAAFEATPVLFDNKLFLTT